MVSSSGCLPNATLAKSTEPATRCGLYPALSALASFGYTLTRTLVFPSTISYVGMTRCFKVSDSRGGITSIAKWLKVQIGKSLTTAISTSTTYRSSTKTPLVRTSRIVPTTIPLVRTNECPAQTHLCSITNRLMRMNGHLMRCWGACGRSFRTSQSRASMAVVAECCSLNFSRELPPQNQ